ncbi:MAG: 50S ribosomal protein L15 [Phycisphaerae bacterium]
MTLDEILQSAGKNRRRRRVGRGSGSGRGKTSGRGHKGYGSRSGAKSRPGYEGGQNPVLFRVPKRGFSNIRFKQGYQVVNIRDLQRFNDGDRVDAAALLEAGLIGDANFPVKVLGDGELDRKLTVVAEKFSASAAEKIAKAGGSTQTP